MDKTMLEQFDCLLNELGDIYRSNILIDLRVVKPKLESLCQLVEVDSRHRNDYLIRFICAAEEMVSPQFWFDITKNEHLLDFCMRRLRWQEIGQFFKNAHENIENPNARLAAECLIKYIYDPDWEGGDFDFLSLDQNIWRDLF